MNTKKLLSGLIMCLALSAGAQAAGFPEKSISVIVPFPPGGSSDNIARVIGPKITAKLGQPWVVDNRPGATGAIGAGYLWQAFAAPKGLPKDVKAKLHGAIVAAINEPDVKAKLVEQGFEIVGNTPEQFEKFQAAELARWKNVIEMGKISVE